MKLYLGSDHAGFSLKEAMKPWLLERGHEVEDLGADENVAGDDYPDFVVPVAQAVTEANDPVSVRGIIFGGSGEGEAMAVNRLDGVRAIVYYGPDPEIVRLGRAHNNANILSLGARFLSVEQAREAVEVWLATPYEGGRHEARNEKMDEMTE